MKTYDRCFTASCVRDKEYTLCLPKETWVSFTCRRMTRFQRSVLVGRHLNYSSLTAFNGNIPVVLHKICVLNKKTYVDLRRCIRDVRAAFEQEQVGSWSRRRRGSARHRLVSPQSWCTDLIGAKFKTGAVNTEPNKIWT